MDELTHIIAKYSPEPEMLLLLIFLFALGKSVIVVSSALPPASVTLLVGILAGKHTLPLGAVWAAIALGATLGSILSFHGGALLCRHDLGRRLPAAGTLSHSAAQSATFLAKARATAAVRLAFPGGDALHRAADGRHAATAGEARLCHRRAFSRRLGTPLDVGRAFIPRFLT